MQYEDLEEYYWTDSQVVLGYLKNTHKRFKVFVANRVQQIRKHTEVSQWNYVQCIAKVKGTEATYPRQKFWRKFLTPYFFYSNLHLHFLRWCCKNIFKFICIVSENIGKSISQFGILFLTSTRS